MIPTKHLVLHFDINETILIGDRAGGDSQEESMNKILAKSAAVQQQGKKDIFRQEPTHWWDGTPIHETCGSKAPALRPEWTWPEGCCPYYRTAYKKRSKNFIEHHGSIYKDVYDRMHMVMTNDYDPVFANIIPSFFYTLHDLYTNSDAYEFDDLSIAFRTFGGDLNDIQQAVHLFATGQHPDFPEFFEPRLQTSDATRSAFVKGVWIRNEGSDLFDYQLVQEDGAVVAKGDAQVLQFLHAHALCGIQDDWEHWGNHDCQPWAGKQVWIPYAEPGAERQYHHVLFDDNIHNLEDDSIAGIRREVAPGEFKSLACKEVLQQHGRHLIKVHTILPILDERWFVKEIQQVCRQFNS